MRSVRERERVSRAAERIRVGAPARWPYRASGRRRSRSKTCHGIYRDAVGVQFGTGMHGSGLPIGYRACRLKRARAELGGRPGAESGTRHVAAVMCRVHSTVIGTQGLGVQGPALAGLMPHADQQWIHCNARGLMAMLSTASRLGVYGLLRGVILLLRRSAWNYCSVHFKDRQFHLVSFTGI